MYIYKIKPYSYNIHYPKTIATGFIFALSGILYLLLIKTRNVSDVAPIISPISLLYVYILGVYLFNEKTTNKIVKTICVVVIVICMAIFQLAK